MSYLRVIRHSLSFIALGTLVSCGGGGDDEQGIVTVRPAVETVAIAPTSVTVVIGEPLQLTATLRDAAGNELTGRTVTWSSSSGAVATVSNAGLVTGVAPSTQSVTITATSEGRSGATLVAVVSVAQFTQLAIGGGHTCGIALSRAAYCWGSNDYGQLGTNGSTTLIQDSPKLVLGGLSFLSLTAGRFHVCGIATSNATYCWGWYDINVAAKPVPTLIASGVQFVELAATYGSTCGRTSANAVYCWGINAFGELGDNSTVSHSTPALISGGLQFVEIVAGDGHYCGRTATNIAYCWGDNRYGEIGAGTALNKYMVATAVVGGLQFIALDGGTAHTCGLTTTNATYCWGNNLGGQLGDNTTIDRTSPTLVIGAPSFVAVTTGPFHTCGRTPSNVIYCWGNNGTGALGDNTTTDRGSPTQVFGGMSFVDVKAGWQTCGRTASNATYCWGGGSFTSPRKPTPVPAP